MDAVVRGNAMRGYRSFEGLESTRTIQHKVVPTFNCEPWVSLLLSNLSACYLVPEATSRLYPDMWEKTSQESTPHFQPYANRCTRRTESKGFGIRLLPRNFSGVIEAFVVSQEEVVGAVS